MTIVKLSAEELARYRQIRSKRAGKGVEPSTITVDVQQRRNMQGMIPVQLWADFRSRAALEMTSTRKLLEIAIETYLAMAPEDFIRIKERYEALVKEQSNMKEEK